MWPASMATAATAMAMAVVWCFWKAAEAVWFRPRELERVLRRQGLKGTPYRFLHGDLKQYLKMGQEARSRPIPLCHDVLPRAYPFLHKVISEHGKISFTWFGTVPRVCLCDQGLFKEALSNKSGYLVKPKLNPLVLLLANGVLNLEGEVWAKHRRILNPAFHLEKLKRMLPAFSICCGELIGRWEKLAASSDNGTFELDVWKEFQRLSGDVISRAAFGSSYGEGSRIFELQKEQAVLAVQANFGLYLPGFRFLPTKRNSRMKEIDREIRSLITAVIKKREEASPVEGGADDLLGLLMESNLQEIQNSRVGMDTEEVIEECKVFYFAGEETTSTLLAWTLVLLCMHPEWQARARDEIVQAFGAKEDPDFDGLSRLKMVSMIFNEVLRLYTPAPIMVRKTLREIELGGITLPPGVQISMPISFIHRDKELWGEDADEFRPERFKDGISKAGGGDGDRAAAAAFFPFGWGHRTCIAGSQIGVGEDPSELLLGALAELHARPLHHFHPPAAARCPLDPAQALKIIRASTHSPVD